MMIEDLQTTDADLEVARQHVQRGVRGIVPALIGIIAVAGFLGGAVATAVVASDGVLETALATGLFGVAFGLPITLIVTRVTMQRGLTIGVEQASQQRRLETEVRRREFETRLSRALEMADDEPAAYDVIRRAMSAAIPARPVELLLADNSHAHLERVVAVAPAESDAPGCPVEAPDRCIAARRAQTQVFVDSEDLDACPFLRVADHDRCAATCVPVSIMGTTVGVVHTIGPVGAPVDRESLETLQSLANQAGNRLGMLRIMAETQLQASTDGLTGLINRRSVENHARQLRNDDDDFALILADLDRFKALNDTHGHDTGDRALRVFADALRRTLRATDLACRYGGEEFVVVMPRASVDDAVDAAHRVMDSLQHATSRGEVPTFTASFGVAASCEADDFDGVVQAADHALFEAKRGGRNRVCISGRSPAPEIEEFSKRRSASG